MSGPLWQGPGQHTDTLPVLPRRNDSHAADPLDDLAERFEEVIAGAVHADEIAAVLESDGMTDDHIRLTYGRPDSFAIAEELYDRVPRRFPEPPREAAGVWHAGLLGCLLRGLVFALPGLAYVLGAPLLRGASLAPLLAGALTGWVWNQALSHRAYSWLGLGDRGAAARALMLGAPAGALLGAAVATASPGQWQAAAFAAAQALYLSAATVLLVLGRERALLCALLPMTGGAVWAMRSDLPVVLRIALLLCSLAAAIWLAAVVLARTPRTPRAPASRGGAGLPRPRRQRPGARRGGQGPWWRLPRARTTPPASGPVAGNTGPGADVLVLPGAGAALPAPVRRPVERPARPAGPRLGASVPYGLFGLGTGVLVLYTALGDVLAEGPGAVVAAPSAVALTLSMGPAEWLLHRFRGRAVAGLRASTTAHAFRRRAAAVLAECLAAFLAVLLVLALVVTLLWPDAPALSGARLSTLLLIGTVLWTGLLMQSFGAVVAAAAVCCAAAAAQTVALLTGLGSPQAVGLGVAGGTAALLAGLVCVLLGRATAHRV
ncbi:hypothetical protein ACFWU3_12840 [Streptomyces sp. NPDC058685]|uniref:hypothetical protein n=1 Tax=Streptomyces sp. NPDC058685 TaxID=3346598 RepID=UPI003647E65A